MNEEDMLNQQLCNCADVRKIIDVAGRVAGALMKETEDDCVITRYAVACMVHEMIHAMYVIRTNELGDKPGSAREDASVIRRDVNVMAHVAAQSVLSTIEKVLDGNARGNLMN